MNKKNRKKIWPGTMLNGWPSAGYCYIIVSSSLPREGNALNPTVSVVLELRSSPSGQIAFELSYMNSLIIANGAAGGYVSTTFIPEWTRRADDVTGMKDAP